MTRLKRPGAERIYAAATLWVDQGLRTDGSLFEPHGRVWSLPNVEDFYERFAGHPDESTEKFEAKLRTQLKDAPPVIYQLAGELIYVYFLIDRATGGKRKRALTKSVLEWSPEPAIIPADLDAAFDDGLVNPGPQYAIGRPWQLWFLLEFVQRWKRLRPGERVVALEDPWKLREVLFTGEVKVAWSMREGLLHLIHPDAFEPMVSGESGDKRRLVEYFKAHVKDTSANVDRQIADIRSALEPEHGKGFNFYEPDLRAQWKPEGAPLPDRGTSVRGATRLPTASSRAPGVFGELAEAFAKRGQAILYGPPGTGKTYTGFRFAVWWLQKRRVGEAAAQKALADPAEFAALARELTSVRMEHRVWWMVANPTEWSWDRLFADGRVDFRYGRLKRNYPLVQPEDLVVGYQATPDKRVVAIAKIRQGLHDVAGEPTIGLAPVARVEKGPTWEQLQKDPILQGSQPMRFRNQGTLFALTDNEAEYVFGLLAEANPELPPFDRGEDAVAPLTRLTFHPAYGYEDFIEGFRPTPTSTGQLDLRLTPGIFKRVCRAAQVDSSHDYVVLIDEINRGNIPKILGELITLLELDKRGDTVILPQSGESFTVPPNLFVLGTMNTADRSIRLLDAALRRRFAFIELMPQPELLKGVNIGGLALDKFLTELNLRIARYENREKQIGHSYFLENGRPITTAEDFARIFRQEVLPLLQEFAYDDFGELKKYLGPLLVDATAKDLTWEDFSNPTALIDLLIAEYQPPVMPSEQPTI